MLPFLLNILNNYTKMIKNGQFTDEIFMKWFRTVVVVQQRTPQCSVRVSKATMRCGPRKNVRFILFFYFSTRPLESNFMIHIQWGLWTWVAQMPTVKQPEPFENMTRWKICRNKWAVNMASCRCIRSSNSFQIVFFFTIKLRINRRTSGRKNGLI